MRIELEDEKKKNTDDSETEKAREEREAHNSVGDEIKDQRVKLKNMSGKARLQYIFDYYKWYFVGVIAVIVVSIVFVRDYKENKRPTYIAVEMLNSNFAYDGTNTIVNDFLTEYNVDTQVYKYEIDTGVNLSQENFDTIMLANQQKLVSMYAAGELDVVIGPVEIMEGAANCDCYGDLSQILPADLIEELKDRDYEFYYYDAEKVEKAREADDMSPRDENVQYDPPYFAGIYLDNCSYLNNNGEYGAYFAATQEKDRPIFTIAANSQNVEHAIEFLKFLIKNR